jgi:hypothetical protein
MERPGFSVLASAVIPRRSRALASEPRADHAQAAIEMALAIQRDADISPQAMIPPGGV